MQTETAGGCQSSVAYQRGRSILSLSGSAATEAYKWMQSTRQVSRDPRLGLGGASSLTTVPLGLTHYQGSEQDLRERGISYRAENNSFAKQISRPISFPADSFEGGG